jgi:hypothetical protein
MTNSTLLSLGLLFCTIGILMIGYAYKLFLNWWSENA